MRLPAYPPTILRALLAGVIALSLLTAAGLTVAYEPPQIEKGTITERANGSTLVAVQGFHFQGHANRKKPARLVSFGPNGSTSWIYDGSKRGANWFYDADPLPNGNVLAVNTMQVDGEGKTLVYELDPETKERVWEQQFDLEDTHDIDLINGDQLLVAAMREGLDDRLFIYDLSEDEVVWAWYFRNHYSLTTDFGVPSNGDWTHVNDVDKIGPGTYMASPRNFDQVIVVDRETKNITLRLGQDQEAWRLYEQHNPTYLETEDGKPVILVANSEKDVVEEYTCMERFMGQCMWERTWAVGVTGLQWPRDANRLPNGNTLITDSMNHRVIEVTPRGRIVWETYVPWAPFSAERVNVGNDGARSPTMYDLGVNGTHRLSGSAGLAPGTKTGGLTFPEWLRDNVAPLPVIGGHAETLASTWASGAPWIRPVWMAPWALVFLTVTVLVLVLWGLGEAIYQRDRVLTGLSKAVHRISS